MKNSKVTKAARKIRRPQRAMGAVLANHVPSKLFVLKNSGVDVAEPRKHRKLNADAFEPPVGKETLSLDGICTTVQQAQYYSPIAADIGRTAADLVILEELKKCIMHVHDFGKLGMDVFCDCENLVVFRILPGKQWLIGMFFYKKSGAVGWPVKLAQFAPSL